MAEPRLFTLIRNADESGVSGTGRVLDGAVFHTGQVVVCWRGDLKKQKDNPAASGFSSLAIYPNWDAFMHVHVDAHPSNRAEVVFAKDCKLGERVRASALPGEETPED